jgi:hypothetical protein
VRRPAPLADQRAAPSGWPEKGRWSEAYGLDLNEHGIPAYPEYVNSAMAMPSGLLGPEVPKLVRVPMRGWAKR